MSERWVAVPGFGGHYEVSDLGRVRSLDRTTHFTRGCGATVSRRFPGRVLSPSKRSNKYPGVSLYDSSGGRSVTVHRIVAEAFYGPCPLGMEVCHNNGVRSDNRLSNLRYDTRSNNHADAINQGTFPRGEAHGMSKLTEGDARRIRARCAKGEHQRSIAKGFGVSQTTVSHIARRRTWAHV